MSRDKGKRPEQICDSCGHTWHPQGTKDARRCPDCGATQGLHGSARPRRPLSGFLAAAIGLIIGVPALYVLGTHFYPDWMPDVGAPARPPAATPPTSEVAKPIEPHPPVALEPTPAAPSQAEPAVVAMPETVTPEPEAPPETRSEKYDTREWKDATGKFTVNAKFRSFSNDVVKIQREDGTIVEIPMERLSTEDQGYINALRNAARR